MSEPIDIIDHLAGLQPGSKGERLRARRPVTKEGAEASYRALFSPADASQVSRAERFAVAAFVAGLHAQPEIAGFYETRLKQAGGESLTLALSAAVVKGAASGPFGDYPQGPLSKENTQGKVFTVAQVERAALGARLAAALEHAHLLVFHPRDASPQALGRLLEAGWSTDGAVTLSQLVAFLSFQIRVVAGLKVLNAA